METMLFLVWEVGKLLSVEFGITYSVKDSNLKFLLTTGNCDENAYTTQDHPKEPTNEKQNNECSENSKKSISKQSHLVRKGRRIHYQKAKFRKVSNEAWYKDDNDEINIQRDIKLSWLTGALGVYFAYHWNCREMIEQKQT